MNYSAKDFENAKFAEHPDGGRAIRRQINGNAPWHVRFNWESDEYMARYGWIPAPTKPQITEADYTDYVDDLALGELTLEEILADLGVKVITDSGRTNTDMLKEHLSQIIEDEKLEIGSAVVTFIANELNLRNVTAEDRYTCPGCGGDGAVYEQVRVGQPATPFVCRECHGDGEIKVRKVE